MLRWIKRPVSSERGDPGQHLCWHGRMKVERGRGKRG